MIQFQIGCFYWLVVKVPTVDSVVQNLYTFFIRSPADVDQLEMLIPWYKAYVLCNREQVLWGQMNQLGSISLMILYILHEVNNSRCIQIENTTQYENR